MLYPREAGTNSPVLQLMETLEARRALRRLFDPGYPAILDIDKLPERTQRPTMERAVERIERMETGDGAISLRRYPGTCVGDEFTDSVIDNHMRMAAENGKPLFVTFLDTEGVPYAISMFPSHITRSTVDAVTGRLYGT